MTSAEAVEKPVLEKYDRLLSQTQLRLQQLQKHKGGGEGDDSWKEMNRLREKERSKQIARNRQILQELEKNMGRIMTSCIYSPSEEMLAGEKQRYKESISRLRGGQQPLPRPPTSPRPLVSPPPVPKTRSTSTPRDRIRVQIHDQPSQDG